MVDFSLKRIGSMTFLFVILITLLGCNSLNSSGVTPTETTVIPTFYQDMPTEESPEVTNPALQTESVSEERKNSIQLLYKALDEKYTVECSVVVKQ